MEFQIPQEAESTVRDLAVRAGFASVEQYVLNLIHRDSDDCGDQSRSTRSPRWKVSFFSVVRR